MAVGAESNARRVAQVFAHAPEHRAVLFRDRITYCIRQIQNSGAGIDRHATNLAKKVNVRAPSILGGELDFLNMLPSKTYHRADGFQGLLTRDIQLRVKVQVRGREKNVQTRGGRRFQGLERRDDIFFFGAGERRNGDVPYFLGYQAHGLEVAAGRYRESRFDDVDAQRGKLPGHADFLRRVHREAGRLFSVAEGGIENAYRVHGVFSSLVTQKSSPRSNLSLFYF
jgi:hypothetical protein